MGVFDFPVSKLQVYEGSSPRPVDIEAYWDRALAEMNAVDPQVTLTPASYQHPAVECFDMYYTGVHGARVYAKYLRPQNIQGQIPALLWFHGYAGNSGDWTNLVSYACAGMCVAAMDCRGQGGKSEDMGGVKGDTMRGMIVRGLDDPDPDRLLFRDIFLDTAELAKIVAAFPEVDGERLAARGGSQGGGLTLACASLANIKAAAPAYPFLSDYKRVWQMDLAKDAYEELRLYFRHFNPTHSREEEVFYKLGYVDIQNITHRIKGKVRMYTGLMDTICPPSTQFAAYNKITSPKEVIFYPDFGHESLPGMTDDLLQWLVKEMNI